MTKEICVRKDRFSQILGYGAWSLITIGIIFILITSSMEFGSNYYKIEEDKINKWCYISVLDNSMICRYNNTVENRFYTSVLALIIDTGVLGIWIYFKQNKLKFKWCSSDEQNHRIDKHE